MALNTLPISVASGAIYSTPAVYNSTTTWTIPSTATQNSTIIVESIGGGGGGNTNYSQIYATNGLSSYIGGSWGGAPGGSGGSFYAGVFRLGWYSTSPAGQTMTITVGAGGTGATMNGNSTVNCTPVNQVALANWVSASAGGQSSITFAGATFAAGAGGAAGNSNAGSQTFAGAMQFDSNLASNLAPYPGWGGTGYGYGNIVGNNVNYIGNNTARGGRSEYGGSLTGGGVGGTSIGVGNGTLSSGAGTDATAGTGGAGGDGTAMFINASTANCTIGRGGNGASPGGGGGGAAQIATGNAVNAVTVNSGQKGGNGGAGRVRIWYQA